MSTKSIRVIKEGAGGGAEGGKEVCIKMGSDDSHFNVSLIVRDKSHKTVSTNHNLFEEKGEPQWNRAKALHLTGLTPYH